MSYKLNLSDLDRDGGTSLTQQLGDLFAAAIESGELEPGEKLPTTRALAAEAGINHLTAARVYRRLAELGYVTATVGRGTFVRSLMPAAADEQGDDWQIWAMPDRPPTYAEQIQEDAFRLATEPGVDLALHRLARRRCTTRPTSSPRSPRDVFREEGGRRSRLPARPRGCWSCASRSPAGSVGGDSRRAPEEIIVTSGARQAIDLVAPRAARARRRGRGRVADVRGACCRRCAPPARA